jgi:hypothetical protein
VASEVEISSMALNKLGAERITSFDDGTNRSNLCRDFYPDVRDAVLRAYPWNCALTQKALAAEVDTPLFGYSYKFQLPVLPYCLRVLKVEDEPDYNIKGRYIHCDESSITIEYIARITDPGSFDSLLKEAIEARLAAELAWPITRTLGLSTQMWGLYEAKLREARTMDGQEGTVEPWEANDLIDCR